MDMDEEPPNDPAMDDHHQLINNENNIIVQANEVLVRNSDSDNSSSTHISTHSGGDISVENQEDEVDEVILLPTPHVGAVEEVTSENLPDNRGARSRQQAVSPQSNDSDIIAVYEIQEYVDSSPTRSVRRTPSAKKRKRSLPNEPTPPKRPIDIVVDDDDDGSMCPICLDSWEMSGTHRLISLKCGHLFGLSCIQRWLNECPSHAKVCPSCKSKAAKRDIRHIYAKKVMCVDKSEEYRLQKVIDEQKTKYDQITMDNALMRVELGLQKTLCLKLQQQLDAIRKQNELQQMQETVETNNDPICRIKTFKLFMEKNIEISRDPGCRVMTYANQSRSLLISQKSSVNLFPGYGIRYLETEHFRLGTFVFISDKQVRDLNVDMSENYFIAAYMDKGAKMFNIHTRTQVATFTPSDKHLWAANFDRERTKFLYLGAQHGSTYVYDVRNTNSIVDEYKTDGDMSPVINICSMTAGSVLPFGGLLVCKLQSIWLFEYTSSQTVNATKMNVDGPFVSMTYDTTTNHILISTRPNARNPTTRYIVANLTRIDDIILLQIVETFIGSKCQTVMSRSTQISMNGNEIVAAYLQDAQVLTTWNLRSKLKMQSMPMVPMVLDMCPIYTDGSVYLSALTENRCRVYKVQMCD